MFPCVYQFEIKGQISSKWTSWFDSLRLVEMANGNTVLEGEILDEAVLYGVISRFRDLGLILVRLDLIRVN